MLIKELVKDEVKALHKTIKLPLIIGGIVTLTTILVFVIWGFFAPLNSAAIANGIVVLFTHKKTVQHLEGGVISEILVKEGDFVNKNTPLIILNNTAANAQKKLILGQLVSSKASESRLLSELYDKSQIQFDNLIFEVDANDELTKLLNNQQKLFDSRIGSKNDQINILHQRIAQFQDQIGGFLAQKDAAAEQLVLIDDEIAIVGKLLKEGLATKPRFLELSRNKSELNGKIGELDAEIARVNESIIETQLQINSISTDFQKDVSAELKEEQQRVNDLQEQLRAANDVLERTTIRAPESGKVTGLKYYTEGGVITPGSPIMDIVPQDDKLVVDARVKPTDIDIVQKGQHARVILAAYKAREVPQLNGSVTDISADHFVDANNGESYFLARIEIDENSIKELTKKVALYPGMPAEVFITTGSRTTLDYLVKPLKSSVRRAFKDE